MRFVLGLCLIFSQVAYGMWDGSDKESVSQGGGRFNAVSPKRKSCCSCLTIDPPPNYAQAVQAKTLRATYLRSLLMEDRSGDSQSQGLSAEASCTLDDIMDIIKREEPAPVSQCMNLWSYMAQNPSDENLKSFFDHKRTQSIQFLLSLETRQEKWQEVIKEKLMLLLWEAILCVLIPEKVSEKRDLKVRFLEDMKKSIDFEVLLKSITYDATREYIFLPELSCEVETVNQLFCQYKELFSEKPTHK